jgi:hypothetical protein
MMSDWTFFSNYGHVLVCLARNREARLRDVAQEVGITERAVQKIVRDLQDAAYLTVTKQGRCNRYRINKRKSLRHGLESHCTVGKLLTLVAKPVRAGAARKQVSGNIPDTPAEVRVETDPAIGEAIATEAPVQEKPRTRTVKTEKKEKKEKKEPSVDVRQQRNLF